MNRLVLMLILLLGVTSIKAQNNVIDQVIWVVGDEAILKSNVETTRLQMQARGEKIEGDPYCFIPEQLAIQKLFLDQAKVDSIAVTSGEINRSLSRYEREIISNLGSKEKVEEYLGSPLVQLREEWREQLTNDYLVGEAQKNVVGKINLSPSEVNRYYDQLSKDSLPYIPTTVELQIITIEPEITLSEIDRVKSRLREFTERVAAGESFSTLAIMYSEDQGSAPTGGELGFMGKAQLVPEFANVAFSLSDPNKVSNVIESEYGFHIIQLIERRGDLVNVRHILLKPNVSNEEIKDVISRLNDVKKELEKGTFSFAIAADEISFDKNSRKNGGLMINQSEGSYNRGISARFKMEELPKEIAVVVDTMKVDQVSAPFRMKLKNGKDGVAMVKLRNRIDGHVANVADDYQTLKAIVENRKRTDVLDKWTKKKIKETYVRIDNDWSNCDFKYQEWNKDKEKK